MRQRYSLIHSLLPGSWITWSSQEHTDTDTGLPGLSLCTARVSDAGANLWIALHYITHVTYDLFSRGFCPKMMYLSKPQQVSAFRNGDKTQNVQKIYLTQSQNKQSKSFKHYYIQIRDINFFSLFFIHQTYLNRSVFSHFESQKSPVVTLMSIIGRCCLCLFIFMYGMYLFLGVLFRRSVLLIGQ